MLTPAFELNRKTIFLFDGIGAVLSFFFTGIALPFFFRHCWNFIAPSLNNVSFSFLYRLFSFGCYCLSERKPWMLLGIILANTLYSILSGILVFTYNDVTHWGQALLLVEIVIIIGVVSIEWRVYRKYFQNKRDSF